MKTAVAQQHISLYYCLVLTVRNIYERINNDTVIYENYSLAGATTFRVGGNSRISLFPASVSDAIEDIAVIKESGITPVIIGGGANIVVHDDGLDSVVVHTVHLNRISREGNGITCEAGALISDVADFAAGESLEGLEFIYKMPGTAGGAVWMNARCYGGEISTVLDWVEYLDEDGSVNICRCTPEMFSYKRSPFQNNNKIILRMHFTLRPGNTPSLRQRMEEIAHDREAKGHFRFPCAGSVFKNNREFGKPSGIIIDEAGLKGLSVGGAMVAPFHGNIIINTGDATAEDIHTLTFRIQERVYEKTRFLLEPEILFLGFGGTA